MKKLTKLNLEELVRQMESVSCDEEKFVIGGDFYYTPEGESLGRVGVGDTIRVIDRNNFSLYGGGNEYALNDSNRGGAVTFGKAEPNAQRQIASNIAGVSFGIINDSSNPDLAATSGSWNVQTGEINHMFYLNMGQDIVAAGNFYDIQLILYHETVHRDQGTLIFTDVNAAERAAYIATKQHPNFKYCSSGFKMLVDQKIDIYGNY